MYTWEWALASTVGTWVLALFAIFTFWKTKNLAESTEDQAKATQNQAEATEKQAVAITKEFELRTRPWITTIDWANPLVEKSLDSPKVNLSVRLIIKNVGCVPAVNARIESQFLLPNGKLADLKKNNVGPIFPNDERPFETWLPLESEKTANDLIAMKPSVKLMVRICYHLSADDPKEHFSYYSAFWDGIFQRWYYMPSEGDAD